MPWTVKQIADAIDASAEGDLNIEIVGANEPAQAQPDQLAMAMAPKYAETLGEGKARVAMLWEGADWRAMGLDAAIFVSRPRRAMAGVTAILDRGQGFGAGLHPTAHIDETAELGKGVSVGPFAVIGARARIGSGSVIGPGCVIGADVEIGEDARLRDQISIGARVRIGDRFWCQPGSRIGADGFSYVTPEVSGVENARKTMGDQGDAEAQSWMRIHSLGAVQIGDNVEIGANCTIDNGTVRDTEIGNGTKLDNLVQVGHNCRIGRDCLLCGQVGLAGSVVVGNNVVLGGQVGAVDNIFIGDNVVATGATKITSNAPAGRVLMGYPAVKMDLHTEIYKAQRRLPRMMRDVEALKKAVSKLDVND